MGYIYVRPNLINGKKYVGQAKDIERRNYEWNNLSRPYAGRLINNARAKYGIEAFGFEILKECEDDELNYWETYYIKELQSKTPNGYNLTDGGEGTRGYTYTEEQRKKRSEAQKGKIFSDETKKKISKSKKGKPAWNKGKKDIYSEETRRKISESHIGKPLSEEHKKKVSESLKGRPSGMKGKSHTTEARRKMSDSHMKKPVLQINKDTGEIIKEWEGTREIERELGFYSSGISRCCNGIKKSAYGFIWRFKENAQE